MQYAERKLKDSYSYEIVDIFGEVEIVSPTALKPEDLDAITIGVIGSRTTEGTVEGTDIKYTFKARPIWEDDEEGMLPQEMKPLWLRLWDWIRGR